MIKHNEDLIWGNYFMWSARKGFNTKGRLRHMTPRNDRVVDPMAVTRSPVGKKGTSNVSLPDGHTFVDEESNYIIPSSPSGMDQAKTAQEHVDNGRLWFYQLHYGDYLIGMNTTRKDAYNARLYELDVPKKHRGRTIPDLVSGRRVDLSDPVVIGPRSTMALYLGEEQ